MGMAVATMVVGAVIGGVISAVTQKQETGSIDVGKVAMAAVEGALIAGAVVLAAMAVSIAVAGITAAIGVGSTAAGAACKDGDCGNELEAGGKLISGAKVPSQGSSLMRYMSEQELNVVKNEGFLRGQNCKGPTFMTAYFYETATGAASHLSLPKVQEYGVEFRRINNPPMSLTNMVQPAFGWSGGGTEVYVTAPVQVQLLHYWELMK